MPWVVVLGILFGIRPGPGQLRPVEQTKPYKWLTHLPIVDMLFGTFCNPKEHRTEVGFYPGASARLGAMLIGRDVSRQEPQSASDLVPEGLADTRASA